MIGADDFQITAGGDYSVPAVGHHGRVFYLTPAADCRSGFQNTRPSRLIDWVNFHVFNVFVKNVVRSVI